MQVRYDEEKEIYRDCQFCGGRGCLACKGEADREYKRQFPDGPKPIMTINHNNPEEIKKVKDLIKKVLDEEEKKKEIIENLLNHPFQGMAL